jgi:Na+/proline symporter
MASFHLIDYCIVAAYLVVVIALGKVAAKSATTGEGFFSRAGSSGNFISSS